MTSVEWFGLVVIPVTLILGGFIVERLHAFGFDRSRQSFIDVVKAGKVSSALVPAGFIIVTAIVLNRAFS